MIIFDTSWSGSGGIGRFADSINTRMQLIKNIRFTQRPASPISTLINTLKMLQYGSARDVFFFPGYIPPLLASKPFVFTIHDLNHIERPENQTFIKRLFYKYVILRGCHKAQAVLTVSEFSRQQILTWSGLPATRVINVGNGVDAKYQLNVKPYQPGFRYVLCVSNRKRHKNEHRLIESFAKANIDTDIKLLFTGKADEDTLKTVNEFGMSDRVLFNGFISEDQLPGLYRGAIALLFPSLYEGFGLPVIEAMACGTPVLTSTTTSLPEVAGDAAVLVNPDSAQEITLGIESIIKDETLREELRAKGLVQCKKFSWDSVAQKVEGILEKVQPKHD